MEQVFIDNLIIHKARHLENIVIQISTTERKHLILTGKNGSGKTTVLVAMKNLLHNIMSNHDGYKAQENQLEKLKQQKIKFEANSISGEQMERLKVRIENTDKWLKDFCGGMRINFNMHGFYKNFQDGNFIVAFFDAKRANKLNIPTGSKKINVKKQYSVHETANTIFLEHLVNLYFDKLSAKDDNDTKTVLKIDEWFSKLKLFLQEIFNDAKLDLVFDKKNYTFNIIQKGHLPFGFNELSDGYSALLSIVTDLMIRMENRNNYEVQGIVIIDEVETHLHIDLQKKIIPFLTTIFPNIQFIVSTHSPFVLSSVENAVIYDLEKKLLVEDLSGYSYEAIVESYFEVDKYSESIKKKVKEYGELVKKKDRTEDEENKVWGLRMELEKLPQTLNSDLSTAFLQIETERLTQQK